MKLVCNSCGEEYGFRFLGCDCDCGGELVAKSECRMCGCELIAKDHIPVDLCEDCGADRRIAQRFKECIGRIDLSNIEKCIELRDKVVGTFGWEYADALCGLINFIEELQAINSNN